MDMDKATEKFWDRMDWLKEHSWKDTYLSNMLDQVLKRAQAGDVAAIRFLEDKGLLTFPAAEDRS